MQIQLNNFDTTLEAELQELLSSFYQRNHLVYTTTQTGTGPVISAVKPPRDPEPDVQAPSLPLASTSNPTHIFDFVPTVPADNLYKNPRPRLWASLCDDNDNDD